MAHAIGCEDAFSKLSIKSAVEIAPGTRGKALFIKEVLYNKLYDYQKEGVRWLFGLYEYGTGGILGDDMGLGKTVQIIAFLSGMIESKFIRCALIIAPMSVINVWVESFRTFSPETKVATFHGEKRAREKALDRIQDLGGVLITTYDLVAKDACRLSRDGYGDDFTWDYVVADEGHQLKNTTIKRSKGAHAVSTKFRVILTGTPLQNKMDELWALFDFTHFGRLLGTKRTFNSNYGTAIEDGRKKCASARARALGNEFAESLRKIIAPYMLRRTKDQVGLSTRPVSNASDRPSSNSRTSEGGAVSVSPSRQKMPGLPRKNDFVIWLTMSKEQEDVYRRFLTTPEVKELLDPSVKRSPLTQLMVLKKLCDHPRLLSRNACEMLGLVFDREFGENQADINMPGGSSAGLGSLANVDMAGHDDMPVDDLSACINQSIKTSFLNALLPQLVNEGHKVLVFSMSLKMLNIVAQVLKTRLGIRFLRLDGKITKLEDRKKILDKFQTSAKYRIMLLTTQVGGVGLTITAADRVVIVDPSWNPATDAQAVDRVYRVGQKQNVIIYRLITAGTVEEKIYRRQVFKVSIFRQVAHANKMSSSKSAQNIDDPMRYFTHQDLKELFKLTDTKSSDTQQQLAKEHQHQRETDAELDEHVAAICSLPGIVGISDHDLLFSRPDDPLVEGNEEEAKARQVVERAKALIEKESREDEPSTSNGVHQRPHFQSKAPLYPTGFGEFKEKEINKPEFPLYLQRLGLVRPGQSVLTPPKLLGAAQSKPELKTFPNLYRSYSDAELNSFAEDALSDDGFDRLNASHDDLLNVSRHNDANDKSVIGAKSKTKKNYVIDEDSDVGKAAIGNAMEIDSDDDVQIVDEPIQKSANESAIILPRRNRKTLFEDSDNVEEVNDDRNESTRPLDEISNNKSSNNQPESMDLEESIILKSTKRKTRVLDDTEQNDDDDVYITGVSNTSSVGIKKNDYSKTTNPDIVIIEDDNERPAALTDSSNNVKKFPRISVGGSAKSHATPSIGSNADGEKAANSFSLSTPFSHLPARVPSFRCPVSPVLKANNSLKTSAGNSAIAPVLVPRTASPPKRHRHGVKRTSTERSIEYVENTSVDAGGHSIVESSSNSDASDESPLVLQQSNDSDGESIQTLETESDATETTETLDDEDVKKFVSENDAPSEGASSLYNTETTDATDSYIALPRKSNEGSSIAY